jgi:hypothetical protein
MRCSYQKETFLGYRKYTNSSVRNPELIPFPLQQLVVGHRLFSVLLFKLAQSEKQVKRKLFTLV